MIRSATCYLVPKQKPLVTYYGKSGHVTVVSNPFRMLDMTNRPTNEIIE